MKIRANLNFFLSKRGGNLKRFCQTNEIKTKESLLGFLDDACVTHPDEEALALLFPSRQKVSKSATKRLARKPVATVSQTRDTSDKLARPDESQGEKTEAKDTSKPREKVKRSSRRRSKRARGSSASEE